MKTFIILLTIPMFVGCAAMGELPSVQNCEYVKYERSEYNIHIEAKCKVPTGGL